MRLVVAALAFVVISGCMQPAPSDASRHEDAAAALPPLALEPDDCVVVRAAHVVPWGHVASQLPAGFVPRDAQGYLGPAVPAGSGLAVTGVVDCPATGLRMAELALFVEAPRLPGDREPAIEDFFVPALPAQGWLQAEATRRGWEVLERDIEVTRSSTGPATAGSATVAGPLLSLDVAGGRDLGHAGLERYWLQTDAGHAYLELDVEMQQRVGAATCTLAGPAQALVGRSTCAEGITFGLVVTAGSWQYSLVDLPGAASA